MEVQLTDFENAAFSIFIVLLTRAILSFDLNFYMPISKVDSNMQRAQKRDAARSQAFHFRRSIFPHGQELPHSEFDSYPPSPRVLPTRNGGGAHSASASSKPSTESLVDQGSKAASRCSTPSDDVGNVDHEVEEMTMNEIVNGTAHGFPGLLGVVNAYLNSLNVDIVTKCELRRYLDLVKKRAQGTLCTPATWIRNFIINHPAYKHDSVVSDEINYDLMKAIDELERGVRSAPELLDRLTSNKAA